MQIVLNEVVREEAGIVRILAVGRKVRNTPKIGDTEIRL